MNISPQTVAELAAMGWDIIRVSDILPVNASDWEILEQARSDGRVIITQDLDFSALLALGGYSKPSLVTLRLSDTDPVIVTAKLQETIPSVIQQIIKGCAITINDSSVRIRSLPIR
jgi:predicted nuclease of predicted toxin-antitoxin system